MLILFHSCSCFATSGRPTLIFMSYILMSFNANETQSLRPTYQFLMRVKHHVYTLCTKKKKKKKKKNMRVKYHLYVLHANLLMRVKHYVYVIHRIVFTASEKLCHTHFFFSFSMRVKQIFAYYIIRI